ncbi:Ig-like domain-containing protein [Rhodocaloribacter sp.]
MGTSYETGRGSRAPGRALRCLAGLLVLGACASPLPPTGGPPDRTPPAVVATEPPNGAVNVRAEKIEITFSEYVDQGSFARAFTLTPDFERLPEFSWHGKRVEIVFPEPLRENTTYILTLDNNLRDLHGVTLREPITLAFSTGPEINRGRLAGRVLEPWRGDGAPGLDVYAFPAPDEAAPDSLPERPAYRTQTGDDGRFLFEYMSEEPFFVIALRDRNRNRRPDVAEAFAVPPRPVLRPDTTSVGDERRWLVTVRDTIPPELRQVRARSSRRLALRFSEAVRLARTDTAGWVLRDSVTGARPALRAVYMIPEDPRQVLVLTDSLAARTHTIRVAAVVDSSGNPVRDGEMRFTPVAEADTFRLRFRGFDPDSLTDSPDGASLPPPLRPAVRFNQPVDSARFRAVVAVRDTTGRPLVFTRDTGDGVTYRLAPEPWPDTPFDVTVDGRALTGADTVFTRRFRRMGPDELGELSGYVTADDTTGALVVELYDAAGDARTPIRTTRPDAAGYFVFRELPGGGRYRLRAFVDRNGNGRWDGGFLLPYTPAEPLGWGGDLPPVRARWETVADDTLRVR